MEQKKNHVKLLGTAAIVLSLAVTACHNNDTVTTDSATDTTKMTTATDTTKMMTTDSVKPPAGDTVSMKTPPSTGMAKPNAAKKGMKGKVMITAPASSGKADAAPDASGAYANVDHMPAFPGGSAGLQKFFDDNVEYPSGAADNGVEGTVMVGFTVDENGKIMSPAVQGNHEGYGLDEEALRVVNKMPAWVPGKVNGKPVKTKFVLPVKFGLQ